jgi:hypothetical protein
MSDPDPRVNYFRSQALDRLQANGSLTTLLEQAEQISSGDGAEVVVPAPFLEKQHDEPNEDVPDVAIAVSVVVSSSDRRNNQQDINVEIQTDLQVRKDALWTQGLGWVDEIRDVISKELTTHAAGWHAEGETGGTVEPLWDEAINRYHVAQRFGVESSDARKLR